MKFEFKKRLALMNIPNFLSQSNTYFSFESEHGTYEPVIGFARPAELCGQPKCLPQHRFTRLSIIWQEKPVGHESGDDNEQLRAVPLDSL